MKNQNDMIVMIVTGVLAVIALVAFFFTKPEPVKPAPPAAVDVSPPSLPQGDVVMADALPNAGSGGGAASAGGRGAPPAGIGGRGGAPAFGTTPSAAGVASGAGPGN